MKFAFPPIRSPVPFRDPHPTFSRRAPRTSGGAPIAHYLSKERLFGHWINIPRLLRSPTLHNYCYIYTSIIPTPIIMMSEDAPINGYPALKSKRARSPEVEPVSKRLRSHRASTGQKEVAPVPSSNSQSPPFRDDDSISRSRNVFLIDDNEHSQSSATIARAPTELQDFGMASLHVR